MKRQQHTSPEAQDAQQPQDVEQDTNQDTITDNAAQEIAANENREDDGVDPEQPALAVIGNEPPPAAPDTVVPDAAGPTSELLPAAPVVIIPPAAPPTVIQPAASANVITPTAPITAIPPAAPAIPPAAAAVIPPATPAPAVPPVAEPPARVAEPQSAVHPEYYSDIKISCDGLRLDFERAEGSELPPLAYRALRKQIEDVSRLARILFQDDSSRLRRFMLQLHLTADSGLRGTQCSPEIGAENLQDVKQNITDEFPAVRGKIWWWNIALVTAWIVACVLASFIYHSNTGSWYPEVTTTSFLSSAGMAAFMIPLGVVVGLALEFIFRVSDDIPYEQLQAINPGRWKPFQRAVNTILVGIVFAFILGSGAIKVGVGSILLNDFIAGQPLLSLAIGFVTGFAYPYVRDLVQQFRPVKRDAAV